MTEQTLASRQLDALDRAASDVRMLVETWESKHEERLADITILRGLLRRALAFHWGLPDETIWDEVEAAVRGPYKGGAA